MTVYHCAEDAGGCGVIWTPDHDQRKALADRWPWTWCPDCVKAGKPEEVADVGTD